MVLIKLRLNVPLQDLAYSFKDFLILDGCHGR